MVFCNAVDDNPFMAGAFHGIGEPECVVNVGVSGPGVVLHGGRGRSRTPISARSPDHQAHRVQGHPDGRAGRARRLARLGVPFGIVDLSLAPTPAQGDSVARILEAMGLERVGTHGSTAALALLNDAVKKGGAMASSYVGGLSGAFIPVSEDAGMIEAAQMGAHQLDKLEAMTCVCSVGLDMIAVPGDTPPATMAAIIADEVAIGMINAQDDRRAHHPGARAGRSGRSVEFGGLLGTRAGDGGAPMVERRVHSPRRPDTRALAGLGQLGRR